MSLRAGWSVATRGARPASGDAGRRPRTPPPRSCRHAAEERRWRILAAHRARPGAPTDAAGRGLLAGRRCQRDPAQREQSGRRHTEGALLGEHEPCVHGSAETAEVPAQFRYVDSGRLGSAAPPAGGDGQDGGGGSRGIRCSRWRAAGALVLSQRRRPAGSIGAGRRSQRRHRLHTIGLETLDRGRRRPGRGSHDRP